ncbi:MAG TPA: phosphoribosylglycinamide formyltransferase [Steroidobacteraceae bacterium]|jgi:phosphoribosylglycinamide formyltransferase-1|nr:phosphoribosylglycinamide formyltransferase [Steroidobacteraceae bacterium]
MSAPAGAGGKLRVAILISGRGSNMAAIAQACAAQRIGATVVQVIADRAGANGIALAASLGLPAQTIAAAQFQDRSAFETALQAALERHGAELVVLAGFMRVLSERFVRRYAGRLLNIHPSLLPKHKGLQTHRRVLEAGEREHGVSVHFVTEELDGGPVICQARLQVTPDDTEHSLAARVQRLEHRIYPEVIGLIASGRLQLRGAGVVLDGHPLTAPLLEDEHDAHPPARA